MSADRLDENLEIVNGIRWLFVHETQKILWEGPNGMPEVAMKPSQVIETYCCKQDVLDACNTYLSLAGAKAIWSDVVPIATCSCCGSDFSTSSWHRVITLSKECGPEFDPEVLDSWYPARFCLECVAVNS